MNSIRIGEIVRFHRKISGLSREACARLAGVGKTAIYDVEHGKATVQLETLLKILMVMNIQITLQSPFMKQLEDENS
ncbi:MAG: helix-turn-helix domain-containing protein [Saprospiraceae bacterium]